MTALHMARANDGSLGVGGLQQYGGGPGLQLESHSVAEQRMKRPSPGCSSHRGVFRQQVWPRRSEIKPSMRASEALDALHSQLATIERDLKRRRLSEGASSQQALVRSCILKEGLILKDVGPACGYTSLVTPMDIAEQFNCCSLSARDSAGRNIEEQNANYSLDDHVDMISDTVRTSAYQQAIARVARGRQVLDVGSGPFCYLGRLALNAGAASVHAVEANEASAESAISMFQTELDEASDHAAPKAHEPHTAEGSDFEDYADRVRSMYYLRQSGAALKPSQIQSVVTECRQYARDVRASCSHDEQLKLLDNSARPTTGSVLAVCPLALHPVAEEEKKAEHPTSNGGSLRCRVSLRPDPVDCQQLRFQRHVATLEVYQGLSTKLALPGQYDLVVHEILGHVASSEGVATAIADLLDRRLCTHDCIFIPSAAGTLFAPTASLELSQLEEVLNCYHNGACGLVPQMKYHVRRFDPEALLAPAQSFEWYDFNTSSTNLRSSQRRTVEFITRRAGIFDGLHFHLRACLDHLTTIDALANDNSTWCTTYVKLADEGVFLPAGARILCDCKVWNGAAGQLCYQVEVSLGPPGAESFFAKFYWEGCS